MCVHSSLVQLFATLWTVTHQAPLSMEFSRQGYWSTLPFSIPKDLPNPGIEATFPALQMDSLPLCHLPKVTRELETRAIPLLQLESLHSERKRLWFP